MEWEIWFRDGSQLDSLVHPEWPSIEEAQERGGVLVCRLWNHPVYGKAVLWGDAHYGHPLTLLPAGWVSDEEFARVLAEAQVSTVPPSQRQP